MKACVLTEKNKLVIEDRPMPVPAEDEVLFRVRACGICGSDMPRVFNGKVYHFPLVLGHEFAGEVVGGELDGMHAAIFPVLPCRECEMCKEEEYPLCSSYDYYGSRRDGGMQEYLTIKKWNLIPVPEGVSFEEAAMCEPSAVARHAVCQANLKGGETVLVYGAGPIGIVLGQWAKSFGASRVLYCDIDERKLGLAESLGFERYNGEEKVDVAIEGAGAGATLIGAIKACKPFGKIVCMGNASGDMNIPNTDYQQILRKQLTLTGTWNSCFNSKINDWAAALDAMKTGALNVKPLITHTFDVDHTRNAFDLMAAREELYSKVMITFKD